MIIPCNPLFPMNGGRIRYATKEHTTVTAGWFRAERETECDVNEVTFGLSCPRTRPGAFTGMP